MTQEKRQLYCVVFAVHNRKRLVIDTKFEYMHADNRLQAESSFRAAHSRALIRRRISVVEVAPAVGYHVEDEHGEVLSA